MDPRVENYKNAFIRLEKAATSQNSMSLTDIRMAEAFVML